jgi:hypothetical protein
MNLGLEFQIKAADAAKMAAKIFSDVSACDILALAVRLDQGSQRSQQSISRCQGKRRKIILQRLQLARAEEKQGVETASPKPLLSKQACPA